MGYKTSYNPRRNRKLNKRHRRENNEEDILIDKSPNESLLDLFKLVQVILNIHNIPFVVDNRTALGALRYRGFIPGDKCINIAINHKYCDTIIDTEKSFLMNNIDIVFYNGEYHKLDSEICKKHIEMSNAPDYLSYIQNNNEYMFMFKVVNIGDDGMIMDMISINLYKQYEDTNIYKPLFKLSDKNYMEIDYYYYDIDETIVVTFEDMDVTMAVRTPEYLKSLYFDWCLVEDDNGDKV